MSEKRKALTVFDLYEYCRAVMNEGLADYEVYISDDEEGNGFHPLYFGFDTNEENIKKYSEYGVHGLDSAKEVVLLG